MLQEVCLGATVLRECVSNDTHLFVLCYGDDGQLAELQALLIRDGWEACLAACMLLGEFGGSHENGK
jgi:hypothetical protein